MFDKMIESNSEAAEFKPRRKYFFVSSVVVGALFLVAVVASIYAGDIGLGTMDFELSEMLAPVATTEPEPQPEPVRPESAPVSSELPSRVINMARVDEIQQVPSDTSVVPSQFKSHPIGEIQLRGENTDPSTVSGLDRSSSPSQGGSGLVAASEAKANDEKPTPAPPPIVKNEIPRVKHVAVVNGLAISLPKPPYPPVALKMNIEGKVDVQVTIDESGKVISAKAASGHPFLRAAAEKAAWSARFSSTTLSDVPVKVTGVIIYNFTRN